jgi:hypothetical protein
MNCNSVRDQLSAYMDAEMSPALAAQVEQHLSGCGSCAKELGEFKQLSNLARAHVESTGQPPAWATIAAKLDHSVNGAVLATGSSTTHRNRELALVRSRNWKTMTGAIVALAATVLVIASMMTPNHETHPTTNQASVAAVNLQPVLELFQTNAPAALNALANQFTLKDVALADADADFGRPTYVSTAAKEHTLPGDAMVASAKTFSFPFCQCPEGQCTCGPGGCHCIACVCERPDGTTYLVLEHCKSQAVSFGDLPVQLVKRGDREVQQITIDGMKTISFDRPTGKITVVGLRGESEIETLMASL